MVGSKKANDTIMAFREFYGEDPFYVLLLLRQRAGAEVCGAAGTHGASHFNAART